MSWETENPVAVVDVETNPPVVVTRYQGTAQAEWFLGYLREHGGQVLREKVDRGGYGIGAPEEESKPGLHPECPRCGNYLLPCTTSTGIHPQGKKEGAS